MMSSLSFSPQPEFFARSLKRKLQSLNPDGTPRTSPPIDIDNGEAEECNEVYAASDITGNKDNRIRKILERGLRTCDGYVVKMSPAFPASGTTFPPNRFINGDVLRAKFHSESNFRSQLNGYKTEGAAEPVPVPGREEHRAPADCCDSDLFFDFDIGSPEQADSDEDQRVINVVVNGIGGGGGCDADLSPSLLGQASDVQPMMSSPDHSTAYGSTTSGIFSAQDTPSPSEVDENERLEQFVEGFSLHPEDWAKSQQSIFGKMDKSSSVTPTMSPHTSTPPADTALSSEQLPKIPLSELTPPDSNDGGQINDSDLNDTESTTEEECTSRDESSASQSDDQELKICIGSEEKSVAQSKLQSLLAQLEKGKEFSPPKKCHLNVRKEVIRTQVLSSSPANFSFLIGSVPNSDNKMASIAKSIRAQSTPDMTEYDKMRCSSMSPKPLDDGSRSSSEQLSTDSSEVKEEKKEAYRRCSSLRSGKTPPTTPGRRKIVRFADVFGLDLADVKTFLDEVPRVPKSAFRDLKDAELSDIESDSGSELAFSIQPPSGPPSRQSFSAPSTPSMAPLFNQPSGSTSFFNTLRDRKVCLESAYMADLKTIKGTIRVVNLDFNKKVVVKYTTDDWRTTCEADGVYLNGSCDGFSDKFAFSLDYSAIAGQVGKRLQFCLKFECAGNDYWDSNANKNYIFQCFGPSPMSSAFPKTPERRRSPPATSTPVSVAPPVPPPARAANNHYSSFSHSPAMHEEPWLRYL